MTLLEALEYAVHIQVTPGLLNKALIDAELDGTAVYAKVNEVEVDKAAIGLLMAVKSLKTLSEGSYSLTVDREAVNERITYLAQKHAITELLSDLKPRAFDGSMFW
jgi:hypothetical protein